MLYLVRIGDSIGLMNFEVSASVSFSRAGCLSSIWSLMIVFIIGEDVPEVRSDLSWSTFGTFYIFPVYPSRFSGL